jgi:Reeler domain-containing protein
MKIFYLVSLSGFKSQSYQSVFKEFMLIAVPSTWTDEQPYRPIGHFELLPSTNGNDEPTQEAVISQRNCPGGVTDANPDKSKNSISVDWIAPRHAQGCVSFKYI